MLKGEFEEPYKHTISKYFSELKYEITKILSFQLYNLLHDVMKLALKVDRQNKAKWAASTRYGVNSEVLKGASFKTTYTTPKVTLKPHIKSEGKKPQIATTRSQ